MEEIFIDELTDGATRDNGDEIFGRERREFVNEIADDAPRNEREEFGGIVAKTVERDGSGDNGADNDGAFDDNHSSHPRNEVGNTASNGGGEVVWTGTQ